MTKTETTKKSAMEGGEAPLFGGASAERHGYATFTTQDDGDVVMQPSETYASASWLSRLVFGYARPVLATGNERQLETDDLWALENELRSSVASEAFQRAYAHQDRSISKAMLTCFASSFLFIGLGSLTIAACGVFAPAVLGHVIDAFAAPEIDLTSLSLWVLAFFVSRLVNAFTEAHVNFKLEMTLLQLTVSLKAMVFEKLTRRSLQSKQSDTAMVDVTNLFTADIDSLMWAGYQVNRLWIAPLQVAVVFYMLYNALELAALAGLGVIAISMYVNFVVAKGSMVAFNDVMTHKDTRMKAIKEAFGAIQFIKLNAWEGKFLDRIRQERANEVRALARYLYWMASSTFLFWAAPLCVSLVSFATFTMVLGKELTAAKVFTSMVLFATIREPLSQFPDALQNALQAKLAIKRITMYLGTDEILPDQISRVAISDDDDVMIALENATFHWEPREASTTSPLSAQSLAVLRDVSFQVRKGDFVVVHGEVGAGKSSLCAALLGELPYQQGRVFVRSPRVAYCSQQPWIQHLSVRDNILFGLPFDEARYQIVLDACGLLKDLAMFPAGDKTEIGQKGVNLSGGQKARLSLARACYTDADIYVLDAPLAAVDAVVQAEIFRKCLCGYLASKTVVLVTHNPVIIASPVVNVDIRVEDHGVRIKYLQPTKSRSAYAKIRMEVEAKNADDEEEIIEGVHTESATDSMLVEDERRHDGRVSREVFSTYIRALGGVKALAGFGLVVVSWQCFQSGSDLWLSHWTGSKPGTSSSTRTTDNNFKIYALLGLGAGLSVLLRAIVIAYTGVRASRQLFDDMTTSLLNAPLRFFDANPIGRVLNRYAEDISIIDFHLHFCFYSVLGSTALIVFRLLTAVYVIQWTGLLLLPLAWVYVSVAFYYLATSREVTRLMKVSTSPILSHVAACEEGVAVLRAFGPSYVDRAIAENFKRCDATNRVWYAQTVVNQWFAVRVQLIGFGVVVLIVSTLLMLHQYLSPGLVGLAFMYAVSIDSSLSSWVGTWSWMEIAMISPERIHEYMGIPPEGKSSDRMLVTSGSLNQEWPQRGTVVFENVAFAYKPGGELVLKDLTFEIHHNEKIGIVGRTGAGKSSLAMALFRINELASGRITIDGVDISTVYIQTLRSRMSIIPQAPTLFKGALRAYMDPFDQYDDAAVWRALESFGMKTKVTALNGKLQYELSENGDNFSVGERQMLCLARALLRKSRVVVMDEATASIDVETEQKLQHVIRQEFVDATVLTIAHRLTTVLTADRILVLLDGRVAEFDTPQALAKSNGGVFYALVQESGCEDKIV